MPQQKKLPEKSEDRQTIVMSSRKPPHRRMATSSSTVLAVLAISSLLTATTTVHAWLGTSTVLGRRSTITQQSVHRVCAKSHKFPLLPSVSDTRVPTQLASSASAVSPSTATNNDDEEYEYVEYDMLTEDDFRKSEWLVGTNWDSRENEIVETWVRLAVDDKGQNVAVWGDDSQGKWSLDVASQFLSISKENVLLGKQIWACTTDDYYYLQGTVRGWNFFQAASVLGQWQAKRLGVDPEEAGTAPWFEEEGDEGDAESDASQGST